MESTEKENKNTVVKVKNLTVSYRSYVERPTTLKESIINYVKTKKFKYYSTFDALKNISFEVKKGEVLGIIGSNGAGKSTLLKTLMGTLPPRQGSIEIKGKVDSLIQLGAGFDSELNAIENIYLNASLNKLSKKEIEKRVPEIIAFAELEEFVKTPIKYYSSGMNARLGFSVAIDKNPDVLLVDEVLAVGDERFKKKCDKVFERFLKEKKTIIMVTHNLSAIKSLAKKSILLSKGQIAFIGDTEEAIKRYQSKDYKIALKAK